MKLKDYQLENWEEKAVIKRITYKDIDILLLKIDRTQMPPKKGRKNIVAVDKLENIVWIADLPNHYFYASYESINWVNNTIQALSGSYLCEIDPNNGKVITKKFVK